MPTGVAASKSSADGFNLKFKPGARYRQRGAPSTPRGLGAFNLKLVTTIQVLYRSSVLLLVGLTGSSWLAPGLQGQGIVQVSAALPPTELAALNNFYSTTNGPGWADSATNLWTTGPDPCSWAGVGCDGGGNHVVYVRGCRIVIVEDTIDEPEP